MINATVLKLGRFGYERIVWYVDPALYQSNDLTLATTDFRFDSGARYGDYEPGKDHAAAYGIAGLVAGVIAGSTAAKVGGVAALALLAKKFVAFIGIGFVAFIAWIKRLFQRKNQTS